MERSFHASVVARGGTLFDASVVSIVAPGTRGYLGVLANHAPIATTLQPGTLTLRDADGKSTTFKSAGIGFLEVVKNNATILLDSIEPHS